MPSSPLLITTTRHTTPRTRSLIKELSFSLDNAIKVNRGKMNILELYYKAKQLGSSRVIIIGRGLHGNPGRITFLITDKDTPIFYPLILKLSGIKLAREIGYRLTKQPKFLVPVILGNRTNIEVLEFAQEFAAAIDRLFFDINVKTLKKEFEKIIIINKSERKNTKYIIEFYDIKKKKTTGPLLFIEKAVYISLPVEY